MAFEHPLPNNLIPEGDICVPLFIPDDPDYIALLVKAVRMLELDNHYIRDANKSALTVRHQWRTRTVTPLTDALAKGIHCGGCITLRPFHSSIEWFPNNPYTEPDLVTEGYLLPAWYVAGDVAVIAFNAVKRAVITSIERLPVGSLPSILPASGLPRFRINVNGTGTVEIHINAINAGGLLQVTVDDDPLTVEWVDTNIDIIAVPPETEQITIIEREFTTPGDHHIDCIIVPSLDDALVPLLYGGGLVKVELCGFTPQFPGTGDDLQGLQMRLTASCDMEFSTDGGTLWQPVTDWDVNGAACFLGDAGAEGTDGTDGLDGTDGTDGDDGQTANEFPTPPTQSEPDALCGAAHKIALELNLYIQLVILDAATITLEEFLIALLGLGGFDGSLLKIFWDYIIANANPNLGTEISAAQIKVAEHFYCAELDIPTARTAINADGTISVDARAAYSAGIDSLLDGWFALRAFVGSLDDTQDCSSFGCVGWVNTFDFTLSAYEWFATDGGGYPADAGHWVSGTGWVSDALNKGGGLNSVLSIVVGFVIEAQVNRVLVEFETINGGARAIHQVRLVDNDIGTWIGDLGTANGVQSKDFTGLTETGINFAAVDMHDTDQNRTFIITKVIFEGTGTDPELGV